MYKKLLMMISGSLGTRGPSGDGYEFVRRRGAIKVLVGLFADLQDRAELAQKLTYT